MRGGPRDGPTEEASSCTTHQQREKGLPHTPSKERNIYKLTSLRGSLSQA
nr:MAG TPA: hypothetical protein [Caudoviricetes sp.]